MWQLKSNAQVVAESKVEFIYSEEQRAWFGVGEESTTWYCDAYKVLVCVEVPDPVTSADGGPSVIE